MTRPKRLRLIESVPEVRWFKPTGVDMDDLDEITLTFDEIEAIRLADMEGLYQEQVAKRMDVSRQTIGRILSSARSKVAKALVDGMAIRLEGGEFQFKFPNDQQSKKSNDPDAPGIVNLNRKIRRIAVASKSPELDGEVDIRFGRAKFFIIYDLETDDFQVLANEESDDDVSGVGKKNLRRVIEAGSDVVISGRVGQKVLSSLLASNIATYLVDGGTIKEVIEQYRRDNPETADR